MAVLSGIRYSFYLVKEIVNVVIFDADTIFPVGHGICSVVFKTSKYLRAWIFIRGGTIHHQQ